MAEVSFQIDPSLGRPRDRAQTIVKGFRFGLFGPGRSRVVIDLAEPACVAKVEATPIAKGAAPSVLMKLLKGGEARVLVVDDSLFLQKRVLAPIFGIDDPRTPYGLIRAVVPKCRVLLDSPLSVAATEALEMTSQCDGAVTWNVKLALRSG